MSNGFVRDGVEIDLPTLTKVFLRSAQGNIEQGTVTFQDDYVHWSACKLASKDGMQRWKLTFAMAANPAATYEISDQNWGIVSFSEERVEDEAIGGLVGQAINLEARLRRDIKGGELSEAPGVLLIPPAA